MAIDGHALFIAVEYELLHYNGKSVSKSFDFYYEDGETAFDFDDLASLTLEIFDERQERRLFNFGNSNLLLTGNRVVISIDPSDIEFAQVGDYYYHLFWLQSGGYEQTLMFGNFKVI